MITSVSFNPVSIKLFDYRTLVFSLCFIAGNILLPQLCHFVPDGGKIFLPIYFFTLIASYKFGIRIGLLTAILSPLLNHVLFGMPPMHILPILLIKSSLLAVIGALVATGTQKISLVYVALVVVCYQLLGGVAEFFITGSLAKAVQDFTLGYPGMLIQVVVGWWILRKLAKVRFQ